MTLVLDASITIAWLFAEDQSLAALQVLQRVETEGAVVPGLWKLEVANALCVALRRNRCDEGYLDRSLKRLAHLPIAIDAETQTRAWSEIKDLAKEQHLTVYDAAYLELALRLGQPLASCDTALVAAARRSGVAILPA